VSLVSTRALKSLAPSRCNLKFLVEQTSLIGLISDRELLTELYTTITKEATTKVPIIDFINIIYILNLNIFVYIYNIYYDINLNILL
jgi:hypothetical protein